MKRLELYLFSVWISYSHLFLWVYVAEVPKKKKKKKKDLSTNFGPRDPKPGVYNNTHHGTRNNVKPLPVGMSGLKYQK